MERVSAEQAAGSGIPAEASTGDERLFVYQGIQRPVSNSAATLDYQVPSNAFGHTNPSATVKLEATLADGSPLPEWIQFNAIRGSFRGTPPTPEAANIDIKVVARDDAGHQAEVVFQPIIPTINGSPVVTPLPVSDSATGTTGTGTGVSGSLAVTADGTRTSGLNPAPIGSGSTTGTGTGTAPVQGESIPVASLGEQPAPASSSAGSTNSIQPQGSFPVERVVVPADAGAPGTPAEVSRGEQRLFVFQGVRDATSQSAQRYEYVIPQNAFAHTDPAAVVKLAATLSDGSPLPSWLNFNPVTGALTGNPPGGRPVEIEVKVTARDEAGREATVVFAPTISPAAPQAGTDRPADQLVTDPKLAPSAGPQSQLTNEQALKLSTIDPATGLQRVELGTTRNTASTGVNTGVASGGFQLARVSLPADSSSEVFDRADNSGEQRLFVYHGVSDVFYSSGATVNFQLPADAFAHTSPGVVVRLDAHLADGSALPAWLSFNPDNGTFFGTAPRDGLSSLYIEIEARDEEGRVSRILFRMALDSEIAKTTDEAGKAERAASAQPAPLSEEALADGDTTENAEKVVVSDAVLNKVLVAGDKDKVVKRGGATFTEQTRSVKVARDPVLARILAATGDKTSSRRT